MSLPCVVRLLSGCIIEPWNSFCSSRSSSAWRFLLAIFSTYFFSVFPCICPGAFPAPPSSQFFDLCVLECSYLLRLLSFSISVSWRIPCCSSSFVPFTASPDFACLLLGPSITSFLSPCSSFELSRSPFLL